MKLALVYDNTLIKSYYTKNQKAYDFNGELYNYHHGISPSCFTTGQNYPFIYDGGYFLNLSEFEDKLPDIDLDMILYANERTGLDDENWDKYSVSRLKKKYPNAKIIGWIKELWVGEPFNYNAPRYINRIKYLKECDAITAAGVDSMKNLEVFLKLQQDVGKDIQWLSTPTNIDYMFNKFYSDEKDKCIFAYLPNPIHRRGRTYEFANYIGKKYNIEVRHKPLQDGQRFDYLTQKEFIDMWSPCLFHFNLDSLESQPGQQCIQVANVGSINIGGLNESHKILYPETATCDEKILEDKVVEYLNNPEKRFEVIEYAWNQLNKLYGFKVVRKQLEELKF